MSDRIDAARRFLAAARKDAAACAALLAIAASAHALTPSQVFEKVSPSVWRIRTYDKDGVPLMQGSAVVIGPEADRLVVGRDNTSFGARLELWDTERDVCQLRARNLVAPAAQLGDVSSLVVGQAVYALGSPLGLELTLSAGLVSSLRRDESQRIAKIQISAPISPGSSGGGLFDDQARLIGLTTSGMSSGQNLNFALPVNWIVDLPQRHAARQVAAPSEEPRFDGNWKVAVSCPTATSGAAGYRFEFAAQVKDGRLRGQYGEEGRASSMLLEGTIAADGRSTLEARGLTGDRRYNFDFAAPLSPYVYHVDARFEAARGAGKRVEARPCDLTFVKQ